MVGVNELKEIAIKCGTPSYIFDTDELCARIDAMQQILGCGVTVCYAMKANPFLISVLDKKLDKFEVCSPGEFAICEKEGIDRLTQKLRLKRLMLNFCMDVCEVCYS